MKLLIAPLPTLPDIILHESVVWAFVVRSSEFWEKVFFDWCEKKNWVPEAELDENIGFRKESSSFVSLGFWHVVEINDEFFTPEK